MSGNNNPVGGSAGMGIFPQVLGQSLPLVSQGSGQSPVVLSSTTRKVTKIALGFVTFIGLAAAAGVAACIVLALSPVILKVAIVVAGVAFGILICYGIYKLRESSIIKKQAALVSKAMLEFSVINDETPKLIATIKAMNNAGFAKLPEIKNYLSRWNALLPILRTEPQLSAIQQFIKELTDLESTLEQQMKIAADYEEMVKATKQKTSELIQNFLSYEEKGFFLKEEIDVMHQQWVNLQNHMNPQHIEQIAIEIEQLGIMKKIAESQYLLQSAKFASDPEQIGKLTLQAGVHALAAHYQIAGSLNKVQLDALLGPAVTKIRQCVISERALVASKKLQEEIQAIIDAPAQGLTKVQFLQLAGPKLKDLQEASDGILPQLREEVVEQHSALRLRIFAIAKDLPK